MHLKHVWNLLPVLGTFAFVLGHAPQARADALDVSYSVHQVSGSTWQYQYSVTGSMAERDDLAIYFPLGTSLSLTDASITDATVSTFVLQPDSALPADGEFDLTALTSGANLAQFFSATFTYSGTGTPGSQAFTLYDSSFNVQSTGNTTLAMPTTTTPEPTALLLTATGAVGLLSGLRRRRS